MRNFMDEVEWSHDPGGGTNVRMIKKLLTWMVIARSPNL